MTMQFRWFHRSQVDGICEKVQIFKLNPENITQEIMILLQQHGPVRPGDKIEIEEI